MWRIESACEKSEFVFLIFVMEKLHWGVFCNSKFEKG